jgi:hypothetical protein
VLAQAAADVGLDRAEISRLLANRAGRRHVGQQAQAAKGIRDRRRTVFHFSAACFAVSRRASRRIISPGAIERAAEESGETNRGREIALHAA